MGATRLLLVGTILAGLLSIVDEAAAGAAPAAVSGPSPFAGCAPVDGDDTRPAGAVEPAVAVGPADPRHVLAAWTQDRFRGVVVGVSRNAGHGWRRVVVPGLTRCTGGAWAWVDNVSLSV